MHFQHLSSELPDVVKNAATTEEVAKQAILAGITIDNIFGKSTIRGPENLSLVFGNQDWKNVLEALFYMLRNDPTVNQMIDAVWPSAMHYYEAGDLTVQPTSLGTYALSVGATKQLSVPVVLNGGLTTSPPLACYWESDNPSVAAVDGAGLVTAVARGTANIAAVAWPGNDEVPRLATGAVITVGAVPPRPVSPGGGGKAPEEEKTAFPDDAAALNPAVVIDGVTYTGTGQQDGSVLFVLPAGTNASALVLGYDVPAGMSGQPGSGTVVDLRAPLTLTLANADGETKDYTIRVLVESFEVVDALFLSTNYGTWLVSISVNEAGQLDVVVDIPVNADIAALPKEITTDIFGLSAVRLYLKDTDGTIVYMTESLSRGALRGYMLSAAGTAADLAALADIRFRSLSYWLDGDGKEYRQTFVNGVGIKDMTIRSEPDDPTPHGGSGGCSMGVRGVTLLLCGVSLLKRSRRRD